MAAAEKGSDDEDDASAGVAPAFRAIHISGHDRQSNDFYPTPDWVTQALLKHVTLRGPVETPREKAASIARATAGVNRVDNQLEISRSKASASS